MEDKQIIDLYFDRDERAISETGKKYGAFCHRIAMNILCIREDAEECVPSSENVEQVIELQVLSEIISDWLDTLGEEDRVLIVRRYWFGDEIKTLANLSVKSAKTLSQKLYRLRKSLKSSLEKKGVAL